jgi:hypothetical protein
MEILLSIVLCAVLLLAAIVIALYSTSVIIRIRDRHPIASPINHYLLETFKSRTTAHCTAIERSERLATSRTRQTVTPQSQEPDLVIDVWTLTHFIWPTTFVHFMHTGDGHIAMCVSSIDDVHDPIYFQIENHDKVCATIDEALRIIFNRSK